MQLDEVVLNYLQSSKLITVSPNFVLKLKLNTWNVGQYNTKRHVLKQECLSALCRSA